MAHERDYGVCKNYGSGCGALVVGVLEVEGLTSVSRLWTFRHEKHQKSNPSRVINNVGPRSKVHDNIST